MAIQIVLTTTGTNNWTVPSDWNNSSNTIEVIGAGGSGGADFEGDSTTAPGGGGGGAYALKNNVSLTPSGTVSYTIGTGGAGVSTGTGSAGNNGGDSWFGNATEGSAVVVAVGGAKGTWISGGGSTGGAGGSSASCVGDTKYSGGNGANGSGEQGGAGGGAAGLNGAGGNASGGTGGTGDNGTTAAGANGTEWSSSPAYGSGGGGAGGYNTAGGTAGGTYGAGGGATGYGSSGSSGAGKQGIIVLTYNSAALRYWVGGSGTWDASTTTNWSASSGGSSGASAPNSLTTAIYFDGNSGGGTVTMGAAFSGIANIICTGFTGTLAQSTYTLGTSGNFTSASGMTWSGTGADTFGGNITLVSGMTNSYTGAITFNSTSSQTITNGGVSFGSAITFSGSGGTWTLQDNMTCPSITLTAGTLAPQTYTISLSGTGTVWSAGGGSFTYATSTLKITNTSSSAKTFAGGGLTYYKLWITGSGTGAYTLSGSNTFTTLLIDTPPHTVNFTAGTTQTVGTFTCSGTTGNLMTLQSTSSGSPWYLVKNPTGVVSCDYLSIQDSHVS